VYRITLQQGNVYSRAELTLSQDSRATLSPADFRVVAAPLSTARGEEGDDNSAEKVIPVDLQFVPGVGIFGFNRKATNYILFGLLGALGHNLRGFGLSAIGLINTGYVRGIQVSGLFNYTAGDMDGMQIAPIFNMTQGDVQGIQAGVIFNYSGGDMDGAQVAPIFNLALSDVRGIQAGVIFNYSGGDMDGAQIAPIFNLAQSGFRGIQMGLVNYSGESSDDGKGGGLRVGLVNISKNERVVPIGLVNIVKNGILHPAVW
jgi:hypothetical protein